MELDAVQLVNELHGRLVRSLSQTAGHHFQGLSQASRFFAPKLTTKQKGHLHDLDTAFNVARHISAPYADQMYEDILSSCQSPCRSQVNAAELFDIYDVRRDVGVQASRPRRRSLKVQTDAGATSGGFCSEVGVQTEDKDAGFRIVRGTEALLDEVVVAACGVVKHGCDAFVKEIEAGPLAGLCSELSPPPEPLGVAAPVLEGDVFDGWLCEWRKNFSRLPSPRIFASELFALQLQTDIFVDLEALERFNSMFDESEGDEGEENMGPWTSRVASSAPALPSIPEFPKLDPGASGTEEVLKEEVVRNKKKSDKVNRVQFADRAVRAPSGTA